LQYATHLYDSTLEGYIQVLQLNNGQAVKVRNTAYSGIKEIIEDFTGLSDVYITPNSFYKPYRAADTIRHFRALFIDLDLKKYSKQEAVYQVFMLADKGTIPKPSMVVDSGRGLHLYWKIEHAPMGAILTWQELEDFLYKQLQFLGADIKATDAARLLRLPGTINTRSQTPCEILTVDNDCIYSMRDLREQYLKYSPKKSNKKAPVKPLTKAFNSYTLHAARLEDLKTLCLLRQFDMTGYRNMTLHCFTYWLGVTQRDPDLLEEKTTEFNKRFTEPLKESEVRAVLRSVPKAIQRFIDYEQGLRSGQDKRVSKDMRLRGGYWYKNNTLIDRLDITQEEQKYMKTIISQDIKYQRKNEKRRNDRRNENGLTDAQQERFNRLHKAAEMRKEGQNQQAIAEALGVTQQAISKYLKEYNKKGSL